jgi:hypothetical protein
VTAAQELALAMYDAISGMGDNERETPPGTVITEPGVYQLSDADYHADPVPGGSLSQSGAKMLPPPSCPARFDHERCNGRRSTKPWDIGHAAHKLVLGAGPELVLVRDEEGKNPNEWRTDVCKARVQAIRDAGNVPLKPAELAQVQAMAAKLREHPIARALFDPEHGKPEQSLIWQGHDVWLRARLDWLPDHNRPGRMVIPDYKTADSANPGTFARDAARYGYHVQDAWYTAAADNVLGTEAAFLFVVQEKTPPYLVTVIELDQPARRAGHERMRRAIEIWRDCNASGTWPAYAMPDEIPLVSLPAYATRDLEENW